MKYFLILILSLGMWACGDAIGGAEASAQLPPKQALASLDSSPQARAIGQEDEIDRFLRKHKVQSEKFAEVRKLVKDRSMTSAVREVQGATQLPLPRAKAIVDTLFHLVHGDKIN